MNSTIMLVDDGGSEAELIREFGSDRALVKYRGVYVFADRVSPDTFELSGEPARPGEEAEVLAELVATLRLTVTYTE